MPSLPPVGVKANGEPVINGFLAQVCPIVQGLQDHLMVIFLVPEYITGIAAGKTFTVVPCLWSKSQCGIKAMKLLTCSLALGPDK